tara:strand:- start:181 stop:681 length:501 start_codon:yes stop_codon:yes gene_type:complete
MKTRKMKYQHGNPDIAKLQVRTIDTVEDGLPEDYDDTLYTEFAKNYVAINRKIKECDPNLSDEVSEIIGRYARGLSTINACLATEFARAYLIPKFGGFVYFVDEDNSKQQLRVERPATEEIDGIYAESLPTDLNDTEWEHVINGVSFSWKEVVMLMRHANTQLYYD